MYEQAHRRHIQYFAISHATPWAMEQSNTSSSHVHCPSVISDVPQYIVHCSSTHTRAILALPIIALGLRHSFTFHSSTFGFLIYIAFMDSLIPTSDLSRLCKSNLPRLSQSDMFFPPPITIDLPQLPLENMEELAVSRLSWFAEHDIEKHVSLLHIFTDLQTNLGVQEWITFQGLHCDESAYDQDAWRKLVKDQQTKVWAGVTLGSLSRNLTRLSQDLIGSVLDNIGSSHDSPQPERVREGMVCFEATLLHDSHLPLSFVEYPAERGPRNGQKDSCACYLQHAQAPDA